LLCRDSICSFMTCLNVPNLIICLISFGSEFHNLTPVLVTKFSLIWKWERCTVKFKLRCLVTGTDIEDSLWNDCVTLWGKLRWKTLNIKLHIINCTRSSKSKILYLLATVARLSTCTYIPIPATSLIACFCNLQTYSSVVELAEHHIGSA